VTAATPAETLMGTGDPAGPAQPQVVSAGAPHSTSPTPLRGSLDLGPDAIPRVPDLLEGAKAARSSPEANSETKPK